MARLFNDAGSQYLTYGGAILTAYPLTMACWFTVDDGADNNHFTLMSIGKTSSGSDNFWRLLYSRAVASGFDRCLRAQEASAGTYANAASGTGSVSTNSWYHGAAVFAAQGSRKCYLDGAVFTNTTDVGSAPSSLASTDIGALNYSTGRLQFHSGHIAEAALWNTDLNQNELTALARGVSPLRIRTASLVGYWPIWATHSPEIDLTSNNRTMTVTGATAAMHAPVVPFSRRLWVPTPLIETATAALFRRSRLARVGCRGMFQ